MQLAGAGGDGKRNSKGLKSPKNAWISAGESVSKLRSGIRKAMQEMEAGQKGAGSKGAVGGLESASAQRELHDSWKVYVEAVNRRCGELSEKLERAGNHHYKNDVETEEAFRHMRTKVQSPDGKTVTGDDGSQRERR
ncbi:hypothetical protein [Streptomyces sp. B15]|uniref:hypothetical protein n=2 Tax=unclassified Streptomyces TaxID=2593676 RepID=UPI001B382D0A|nr:hypothetical protein [Streptomyces sp. B15]MBQ0868758.1 hypothetical protein [Streptomyces sp. RK75]MBQ1125046.1 hypothetical protein [Streptomyces sp. B15]